MNPQIKDALRKALSEASKKVLALQEEPGFEERAKKQMEAIALRAAIFLGKLEIAQRHALQKLRDKRYRE